MAGRNNPRGRGRPNHSKAEAQRYSNDELTSHPGKCPQKQKEQSQLKVNKVKEQIHQSKNENLHLKKEENLSDRLASQTASQLMNMGDDNLLNEEAWKTKYNALEEKFRSELAKREESFGKIQEEKKDLLKMMTVREEEKKELHKQNKELQEEKEELQKVNNALEMEKEELQKEYKVLEEFCLKTQKSRHFWFWKKTKEEKIKKKEKEEEKEARKEKQKAEKAKKQSKEKEKMEKKWSRWSWLHKKKKCDSDSKMEEAAGFSAQAGQQ
ncbi:stress response protein NST1-like [Xiphias gladius]|uniref:stress response protein NST1-like n=2 Tax=Xiphias gladius TaxID=8245 RepID=UPI001A97FDBB|nr:stress response protein NST1-like [Xiphias gladius]